MGQETLGRWLYKLDTKGKLRVWRMELDGDRYRTEAGLAEGRAVVSAWTDAKPNRLRTVEEQARFEVEATYIHKLTREYHETPEGAQGWAHFFKPMLAETYKGWPGEPVYVQPKLDGIRCIATKDGLWSRQGKPILGAEHVKRDLETLFAIHPETILDGELYNHAYRDDFGTLVGAIKRGTDPEGSAKVVQYHVYDCPSWPADFGARAAHLRVLFLKIGGNRSPMQVRTEWVEGEDDLAPIHERYLEQGYEGSIVRLDRRYEQKRSKSLLKRKEFQDAEFECVSIEEGQGNWAGVAKRVVCRLPDGRTFGAGIKGTRERAAELLGETHKVVTVKYFALTPDGIPRFPVAIKFHGEERTL